MPLKRKQPDAESRSKLLKRKQPDADSRVKLLKRRPAKKPTRGGPCTLLALAQGAQASSRSIPIPAEVLSMIVQRLSDHNRSLLLLSMVCRATRDLVLDDHQLWYGKLLKQVADSPWQSRTCSPAVVRDIPMPRYPNFKNIDGNNGLDTYFVSPWSRQTAGWPKADKYHAPDTFAPFSAREVEVLAAHTRRALRFQAFPWCRFCGRKDPGNFAVWGLGGKVCAPCLKLNLVSSAVVFEECGLELARHIDRVAGRVYMFTGADRRDVLAGFSHHPADFRVKHTPGLVFFWRPHLSKLFDLDAARRDHRAKKSAFQVIQAKVRGLCTRLSILLRVNSTGAGKLFCHSTAFSAFVDAPAAPGRAGSYSDRPLTEEQKGLVRRWLPTYVKTKLLMEPEVRAYRLLHASFLAYRGRGTLPRASKPEKALERLRMNEAVRHEYLVRPGMLNYEGRMFRRWRDMPPLLARS